MKVLSALAVVCALSVGVVAQDGKSVEPKASSPGSKTAAQDEKSERTFKLFVRGYGVVDSSQKNIQPLNVAQKFRLSLHYFDPPTYIVTALQSGMEQALDSKHGYGQGAEGFGKRYGADFADGLTSELLGTAIFPSIFHTDPRYFRRGEGGAWSRSKYAMTRVFVTRTDSGRSVFNFPGILGAAGSSAISNAYYPRGERSGGDMATRFGIQMGITAGFNVLKEFSPELKRKLMRKKKPARQN